MSPKEFLMSYSEEVIAHAEGLRSLLLANLPGVHEEVDLPAKMIAYSYGRKYTGLVCVIIPSKKGIKLGFNKGTELPDPNKLLQGTGKISRYVEISSAAQIQSAALRKLVKTAYEACQKRTAQ